MHIFYSGWVILKEKSISQIILHGRIMSNKTKHQTIFNKSMKECLFSRLAKHILLIPCAKEQIGANNCQKHCSKLSYWQPEGGLGLKSCDHIQVQYLESALIEDRSWNKCWEARLTLNMTFCQQRITFITLILEFLPKKERDDPQKWASVAYILVWADRWKVQFSAILSDNWINFKIESFCQQSDYLNVTFWFMILSLVLVLWAKWYQISEKNLNFWHSYLF